MHFWLKDPAIGTLDEEPCALVFAPACYSAHGVAGDALNDVNLEAYPRDDTACDVELSLKMGRGANLHG